MPSENTKAKLFLMAEIPGNGRGMSDSELLSQFESLELPFAEWTHRCHVKVAYLYLKRLGAGAALPEIRTRIRAYNKAHCVPDTPTSGYSETMTCAFVHLIAAMSDLHGAPATADEFCDAHPELMTRRVLRLFYSPARFADVRHKDEFLAPDLAPLPKVDHATGLR